MIKILYTNQQKQDLTYPTSREVLKELHKRNALDQKLTSEYNRLEKGYEGEERVFEYFTKYGQKHWRYFRNVWLDYYGNYEIDLIVITSECIYTFEVKHYSGTYEFKNNQCIRDGKLIGHNAISQAQKSFIHTKNLFQQNGFNHAIQGGLLFIGDHCHVTVADNNESLDVLTLNQLRAYIYKMANQERASFQEKTDSDRILNLLNQYAVPNPFPPTETTDEMVNRMQKGVICSNCAAPNICTRNTTLACKCGMYEPRENAIIRTICEYGIIHFDKELTTGALVYFFNGDVKRTTIYRVLNQYFVREGIRKGAHYKNIRKPIAEASDIFKLERSRYFYC